MSIKTEILIQDMICYCCFRLSLIYSPHVCSMYILIFRTLVERSSLCYHYQSLGFCTWKSGNVIFGIPEPVPFNYLSVQLFNYMHFPKRTSVTCTIPIHQRKQLHVQQCLKSEPYWWVRDRGPGVLVGYL